LYLNKYFNGPENKYKPNLKNKIVIVTGGNTGIGYFTAIEIAKLGAKIIIGKIIIDYIDSYI
jgi:NADP-dependent 3-hydroxy acid dehydrogenase YdfG